MNPQHDRMALLEAQVHKLQERLSENTSSQVKLKHLRGVQEREKEEWRESTKSLEEQLAAARQQCRDLTSQVQESLGEGIEGEPVSGLQRSLSSQSLPAHVYARENTLSSHHSPPSSLYNYPLHSQMKPTPSASYAVPLANSTLLGHSHISTSNSSINSIKSVESARTHTTHGPQDSTFSRRYQHTSRVPLSSTPRYLSSRREVPATRNPQSAYNKYLHDHASVAKRNPAQSNRAPLAVVPADMVDGSHGQRGSASSDGKVSSDGKALSDGKTLPDVELHRSKLKIKQLQKEVSLLDDQLVDKGRTAQNHVEELVLLRTELAQEKASLAIVKQEIRDQAAREVGVAKTTHERQVKGLEAELKKANVERGKMDANIKEVKTRLKVADTQCQRLGEQVLTLQQALAEEKEARSGAEGKLRGEAEDKCAHIVRLEGALRQCQAEIASHVTRAEEDSTHNSTLIWQMRHEVDTLSRELKQKDAELARKVNQESYLQQDLERVRAELHQDHTSWQETRRALKESEVTREELVAQLSRANRKLTHHSAQLGSKREAMGELDRCRAEVQRLEGMVRGEITERGRMETEVRKWKREKERMERRCEEERLREEKAEQRLKEERHAKEACEKEGEELRKEVGRLSKELRACQHQLQGELEGKGETEQNMEDTLTHLQQELTKRAQQVLEMDRLLQSHQADTTARRLQLERTLSQRQADLRNRTQEVDDLTSRVDECEATITDLKGQLAQAKEDQKNLFSGSQAQLLVQDTRVSELKRQLEGAESEGVKVSKEVEKLQEELRAAQEKDGVWQEKEGVWQVRCQQLEDKVKVLSNEKDSLHSTHLSEVQRLQALHVSQLASREDQAGTHRVQLQMLTQQEKVRQEELSRYRVQVASLSAELSAERAVSEETRQQVAAAKAEVSKHKAQVTSLETSVLILQETFEQQAAGIRATPTADGSHGLTNGIPRVSMATTTNGLMLPNHINTSQPSLQQTTPTGPQTPPTRNNSTPEKGGIISM